MDTFGNGEVLAITPGGYGSRGGLFIVNYFVPRANGTNWFYNVSNFNNATDLYAFYGEKLEKLYSYAARYNNISAIGGYSFDRNRKLSVGLYGAWVDYKEIDDYYVPDENNYLSFLGSIVWGIKEFKLFYSEGWSFTYNYRAQMYRSDERSLAQLHKLNGEYTYPLTDSFVVSSGFKFGRGFGGTFVDSLTVGGGEGYRWYTVFWYLDRLRCSGIS